MSCYVKLYYLSSMLYNNYGMVFCVTLTMRYFSVTDGYALSLRCKNEFYELDIRHYQVRVDEEGSCRIEADSSNKTFSNITDLIRFYTGG